MEFEKVTSRRQDAQGDGERDGLLGGSDGGQDRALGLAVGHALGVEAEARDTNEEEGQPDDSEEKPDSPTEGEHLGLQFRAVDGEDMGEDDGSRATPNLADRCGTWNPEVSKQARVALLADELTHPMVVGTAAGGGRHGAW
jgi:hypothetical protein